jgi:hypothetical protein
MAGTTRLELATSAVTGQRSNQLNYVPNRGSNFSAKKWAFRALNQPINTNFKQEIAAVPAKTQSEKACVLANKY